MIKASNLYYSYGKINVLNDINLEIKKGEFVCIVGDSGAGKTTLLQLLGTLERIQKGTVEINGTIINNLKSNKLAHLRNKEIGFIFQFHNLLSEFTALENIMLPGLINGNSNKEVKEKAIKLLNELKLSKRSNHYPDELSGGEKQRIAVARSLINSPSIIFADEPSGNLDSKSANDLHKLLHFLNKKNKQTLVVITHNNKLAEQADRIIKIQDGKII
ncbi:MAG: lipoprotein-releasing system ATP-binding protein LolD [Flavobacteriales bacterium]|nr:lipoprotein-releasing system ATP-binding protein LolD [Flavobacteriales bacterium]|tara:strand:+ start:121 stop:771 length:651 start_codon:yes stop_codon:yes gene_type:complete